MNRSKRFIMVMVLALTAIVATGANASASALPLEGLDFSPYQRLDLSDYQRPTLDIGNVCANHPYQMWCFELCSFGSNSDYCNLTVDDNDANDDGFGPVYDPTTGGNDPVADPNDGHNPVHAPDDGNSGPIYAPDPEDDDPVSEPGTGEEEAIVCTEGTSCYEVCPNGIYFPDLEFCMDDGLWPDDPGSGSDDDTIPGECYYVWGSNAYECYYTPYGYQYCPWSTTGYYECGEYGLYVEDGVLKQWWFW